jgi:tetratricopeptide (TPR) repeat protein
MKSAILLAAALAAGACQSKEAPQHSLGAAGTINVDTSAAARAVNPHKLLPPAAKAALDSGNTYFKAKKYDAALAQYRAAANLAPANAAPFYGIYMVADKLGNRALADSAMKAFNARASDGAALFNDSLMKKTHTNDQAPPANPRS